MSTLRCAKCRGIIRPSDECLIDDNDADIHAACPVDLFGNPVDDAGAAPRGMFASLGLDSDKGRW
jgi:hypothetical protein